MENLRSIFPFFIVENLTASISFYTDKLGFEVRYIGPDDSPYWAIIGRDHISMMIKAIAADVKPIPNHTRHEWARWDAYINAEKPGILFEEFQSKGVEFHQPLKVNSDGLIGFEVKDADGYVLFFGRPDL